MVHGSEPRNDAQCVVPIAPRSVGINVVDAAITQGCRQPAGVALPLMLKRQAPQRVVAVVLSEPGSDIGDLDKVSIRSHPMLEHERVEDAGKFRSIPGISDW